MTIAQWDKERFIMDWSIYDQRSYQRFEDNEPYPDLEAQSLALQQVLLDLTAPEGTPDGILTLFHDNLGSIGTSCGVIVRDCQFVPHPTQNAIMETVAKSCGVDPADLRQGKAAINYIFIEAFDWHPDTQRLEVFTGS